MDVKLKELGLNSVIVRDKDILFSELDGEIVMVSLEKGEYYGINTMGTRIWSEIEKPRKIQDLLETLMVEYHVTWEQCVGDVLSFLNKLVERDVIHTINDGNTQNG